LGLLVLAAGVITPGARLRAQEAGQGQAAARALRLSSVEGQVQLTQGNQVLANPALANAPLFVGNRISTADDGRAEIQFEDGSVARLSPDSSLKLKALSQQNGVADAEIVLASGLGYFELQGDTPNAHIRVRFGDAVVTASGFTVLRVDLDNPPGELAVFSGNAHLERANALALDLHGGESATLHANDPASYTLAENIEPNSWDAWNSDRDQALTSQEAARTAATSSFVNSNNPAWSDLDANGNWYNVPGQGYVWSPYEAANANWDPYGCGSWMWTGSFGYSWVSCESWGYMPYESGLWNYYPGFGWGWEPGIGMPWWGGGGWGYNIGQAPLRYRPPNRPRVGPVRPGGGTPLVNGRGRYQPYPVVAVNRMHDLPSTGTMRDSNAPRQIAGTVVQPLRPLSPRPVYDHVPSNGGVNRPEQTYQGAGVGARYGYTQSPATGAGNRQSYWTVARPSAGTAHPATNNSGSYVPRTSAPSAPAPRVSAPAPAPRASAPSYSSGGGASAGHSMGGGGGGGGGGGHAGGGHH
jgi:hypothetical protein